MQSDLVEAVSSDTSSWSRVGQFVSVAAPVVLRPSWARTRCVARLGIGWATKFREMK